MYRRFVILLVAITAIALGSVSAFGEPLPGQLFQVH